MENKRARAFYEAFLIAIIFSWLPSKALNYLTPFVAVGWVILRQNSAKTVVSAVLGLVFCILVVVGYVLLSKVFEYEYIPQNSFLAFVTYGSFFFLLATWGKVIVDRDFYLRVCRVLKVFIFFEGLVGLSQYVISIMTKGLYRSTGDSVQGSIYFLSFLENADMGFGNQIYAINMSMMILFLLPAAIVYRSGFTSLLVGVLALMASGVFHIIMPYLLAVILVFISFRRFSLKLSVRRFAALMTITLIGTWVIIAQIGLVVFYVESLSTLDSPRFRATISTFVELPRSHPQALILGLGPGQYSSRAALIGTGEYIGGLGNQRSVLSIKPAKSEAFLMYIEPENEEYRTNPRYGFSTMARPYYSVMSVVAEFGLIFLSIMLMLGVIMLINLRLRFMNATRNDDQLSAMMILVVASAILFLVFISPFENYLEVPQAIFPGIILIKIFYNSTKTGFLKKVA